MAERNLEISSVHFLYSTEVTNQKPRNLLHRQRANYDGQTEKATYRSTSYRCAQKCCVQKDLFGFLSKCVRYFVKAIFCLVVKKIGETRQVASGQLDGGMVSAKIVPLCGPSCKLCLQLDFSRVENQRWAQVW